MVTQIHQEQEVAIFTRLFQPENADLSPEAARSFLALEFTEEDRQRMHALTLKAQEGILSEAERAEMESYSFVGNVLGILKSKARQSLKQE